MTKQIGHREFMNLRHKLEKKRTQIKINKEQWIADLGHDTLISEMTKEQVKTFKRFEKAINSINAKIRTLKTWENQSHNVG
tara:strand:- start:293 stop:535 length:243 start_codon:yes stop_codon:yes gene_type:complete